LTCPPVEPQDLGLVYTLIAGLIGLILGGTVGKP
jgi:hypothetical protein